MTNSRFIIGFAGQDGTGKTTLADNFFNHHNFTPTAFRAPAYNMLKGLLPFDCKRLYLDSFRHTANARLADRTPANVLNALVAFIDDALGESYLHDTLAAKLKLYPGQNWTVDDVTTEADVDFLIQENAFLVLCTQKGLTESQIHPDSFDLVVNTEDIDQATREIETRLFS